MNTPPGSYSVNRLIEWMFAALMVGVAFATTATFGQSQHGAFSEFAKLGMTDAWVVLIFLSTGFARLIALYLNGRMAPFGPWLRVGGSIIGALMWGNLFAALLWLDITNGVLYRFGLVSYLCFTVFEIVSCHRAANDSRIGRF